MTGGCCSAPITETSLLVPPLSQQLKVLIFFVTTAQVRYAASHVPITLLKCYNKVVTKVANKIY